MSDKYKIRDIDKAYNNPVVEMIVSKPEDYLFSSAKNYAGLDNVLEVY